MNTRPKDPARVRADALRVASRKLAQGCGPCADSYADLARRNGASEEEIRGVYQSDAYLARSAAVAGFFGPSSMERNHHRQADLERNATRSYARVPAGQRGRSKDVSNAGSIDPFGTDSNTSPNLNPLLTDFYIGRLGFGLKIDSRFFNTAAAVEAGPNYTYGFWGLVGPERKPGNVPTNHDWGVEQAKKAVEAKTTGPNAQYIGGQTIFADVEAGFRGWGTRPQGAVQQSSNQEVLNGFLDHIASLGGSVGVYINALDINGPNNFFFGPNYAPSRSFVLWIAGKTCDLSICEASTECVPCQPECDPRTIVQNNWNNILRHACWAGQGAVIWQFWISECPSTPPCPGDFNYSPQSGFQLFTPAPCTATPCLVAAPFTWTAAKVIGGQVDLSTSTFVRFIDITVGGRIYFYFADGNLGQHKIAYSDNNGLNWTVPAGANWLAETIGGLVALDDESVVIITRQAAPQRSLYHWRWNGSWVGATTVDSVASPLTIGPPRPARSRSGTAYSVLWRRAIQLGDLSVVQTLRWAPITASGLGMFETAVDYTDWNNGQDGGNYTLYYNESDEPVVLWTDASASPTGKKRTRSGGTWGSISSFDTTNTTLVESMIIADAGNLADYSAAIRSNGDVHAVREHAGGNSLDLDHRRRVGGVWTENVLDLSSVITGTSDSTSLHRKSVPISLGARMMIAVQTFGSTTFALWFVYNDL